MAIKTTFEYIDSPDLECDDDCFVVRVPADLHSTAQLLDALAIGGGFPAYFGGNWNALMDCLRDLSWIDERTVVVLHADLPLAGHEVDCRIYLEILAEAQAAWAQLVDEDAIEPPPEWQYVPHELRVVFPTASRSAVARLVAQLRGTSS